MFVGTWFSAYFRASESLLRVRNRNVTSRFRQETKVNFQSISTNVPALQWSESEDETDDDETDLLVGGGSYGGGGGFAAGVPQNLWDARDWRRWAGVHVAAAH